MAKFLASHRRFFRSTILLISSSLVGCASAPQPVAELPATYAALRTPANADAKSSITTMLSSSKNKFDRLFALTSGFSSVAEFEATMDANSTSATLLKSIQSQKFADIAMYRREEIREKILKRGFLNLYQVHESGGSIDNEDLRTTAESNMLGLPLSAYKVLSSSIKPKSTMFQPKIDSTLLRTSANNYIYGEDAYIFKPTAIRPRCTWTPTDSLDRYVWGNKITPIGVHPENLDLSDPSITPEQKAEAANRGAPAAAWDQMFIPCEYQSLMIPFVLPYIKTKNVIQSSGIPYTLINESSGEPTGTVDMPPHPLQASKDWQTQLPSYIEVQVWGALTLDDVEAFQFSKTPPQGEFLNTLLQKKIEIRDARAMETTSAEVFTQLKPKIWHPNAK